MSRKEKIWWQRPSLSFGLEQSADIHDPHAPMPNVRNLLPLARSTAGADLHDPFGPVARRPRRTSSSFIQHKVIWISGPIGVLFVSFLVAWLGVKPHGLSSFYGSFGGNVFLQAQGWGGWFASVSRVEPKQGLPEPTCMHTPHTWTLSSSMKTSQCERELEHRQGMRSSGYTWPFVCCGYRLSYSPCCESGNTKSGTLAGLKGGPTCESLLAPPNKRGTSSKLKKGISVSGVKKLVEGIQQFLETLVEEMLTLANLHPNLWPICVLRSISGVYSLRVGELQGTYRKKVFKSCFANELRVRVAMVWFVFLLGMELFQRFQFAVWTVPLGKGFSAYQYKSDTKAQFRFQPSPWETVPAGPVLLFSRSWKS